MDTIRRRYQIWIAETRPWYDSANNGEAEMTDQEVGTLKSMVARYLEKVRMRSRPKQPQTGKKGGVR